jgi:methoxymalonate biosynthesis acyl carrier protein
MDVAEKIREFIKEEVVLDADASIDDNAPLLEGILDSLALMQLVAFLEEEFETEIDDTDVTAENFRTIADIERLVGVRLTPA